MIPHFSNLGDAGNEFYMILQGKVGVYIQKPKEETYGLSINMQKLKKYGYDLYTVYMKDHMKSSQEREVTSATRKKDKKNSRINHI